MNRAWGGFLALTLSLPAGAESIRVAIVQMAIGPTLEVNRDRILQRLADAKAGRARVAVFPEWALTDPSGRPNPLVTDALDQIRDAARRSNLYVLFSGRSWSDRYGKTVTWMKVIGPAGEELLHYDKVWEVHEAPKSLLFSIDGAPAGAILCADRWLRTVEELPIQQGARISFELAANYESEWVPELEWYWYVPRALRNNVHVVFANTASPTSTANAALPALLKFPSGEELPRGHGHSAVIAPDGTLVAALRNNREAVLFADLDLAKATRREAVARRNHPVLRRFWEFGSRAITGAPAAFKPLEPHSAAETELAVGVAQVPDGPRLEAVLRQAAEHRLDLVALTASPPFERVYELALRYGLYIAFSDGETVWVVDSKSGLVTRHRALTAGGLDPTTMWFRLKGVPAIVSSGKDALWNEIAELAAVAGARIHVNFSKDGAPESATLVRQRQIGATLSSFLTMTLVVRPRYSAIWDDLVGLEETRAETRGLPRPQSGPVLVYSPFSANLAAEAGPGEKLIVVRRRIPGTNPYYQLRAVRFQPTMAPWYAFGAQLLHPQDR